MTETPGTKTFTVRETNARIGAIVERETVGKPFWISGIVRKHFISDLGHEYFDLEDENFTIRCMLREGMQAKLPFSIANHIELQVFGTLHVYEKAARVEIEVDDAHWIESILPRLNEDVQSRLAKKGLWPKPKRALPDFMRNIGLITSKHSEAREDFFNNYRAYGGTAQISLKDVRVQGEQAPREIADMIRWFNQQTGDDRVDVIVLTRGGGRNADLAVFSDVLVAEEICRSEIPVVTGIGHELNQTFADIAADVSKGTPTAIAVYLAQERSAPETKPPDASIRDDKIRAAVALIITVLMIVVVLAVVAELFL